MGYYLFYVLLVYRQPGSYAADSVALSSLLPRHCGPGIYHGSSSLQKGSWRLGRWRDDRYVLGLHG